MNIEQVKSDFNNGILICRSTIGGVIAVAETAPTLLSALTELADVMERHASCNDFGGITVHNEYAQSVWAALDAAKVAIAAQVPA